MPCGQCGFHNLPGTAQCVSCRAPLGAARPARAGVATLMPPRATPWSRLRQRVARALLRRVPDRLWREVPKAQRIGASLVPGLPQMLNGELTSGVVLAAVWVLGLAAGLYFAGSATGFWTFSAAVSAHVLSVLMTMRERFALLERLARIRLAFLVLAVVGVGLYGSLLSVANRYVELVYVNMPTQSDLVRTGDTVLVTRRDATDDLPANGDLVAIMPGRRIYGFAFDRVLGGPGDTIAHRQGAFYRNGMRLGVDAGPVGPDQVKFDFEVRVPEGRIFLWPSLAYYYVLLATPERIEDMALFSAEDLYGDMRMIYHPLDRRRWLAR